MRQITLMKWLILLCLSALPAFADDCPAVADHSVRLAEIVTELQSTRNALKADDLNQELWSLWTDAPDAQAQELLDEGMRRRSQFNFLGARDTFDALVEYCPEYAEGYNQRAFASFLRQDYEAALIDLDMALEITPNHIAALSGKGLTLLELGRDEEAQKALRDAVRLNPWLSERALLTGPPELEL